MEDFEEDIEDIFLKYNNNENNEKLLKLEEKLIKKTITHDEYKQYIKLKNIKENTDIIQNLIEHIKELKTEIKNIENEKQERQKYREFQVEMRREEFFIKKLESENIKYCNDLLNDDVFIEEKESYIQRINENLIEINIRKKKLSLIMDDIQKMKEILEKSFNKDETFEEKNTRKRKIKEKMRYYYEIVSYLLNGKTWDDALIKFLDWQKKRYRIGEKNDSYTIKEDIKQMQKDKNITDEIIDVALLRSVTSRENDDTR